jgi:3D-(3,5/4)-trihydroxycyclohexane-1,2-dione acylhydrolase (decyclizing)
MQDTIRLTVAQAIVRWLMNQFTRIDGVETHICGGGFGIFGQESFNNLIADGPTVPDPFVVGFEAHTRAMGALAETVANPADLGQAFKRAKAAKKTSVIVMQVDPYDGWTTQGHAWWEIGTAQVPATASVTLKHTEVEAGRAAQRQGV